MWWGFWRVLRATKRGSMTATSRRITTGVRRGRHSLSVVVLAVAAFALVASSPAPAATRHSGPLDVLYAGSLSDFMTQRLAPAFFKATGYQIIGVANGSSALASEIKGGTQVGDVFISASPASDVSLRGAANGSWVSTYHTFATSRLVLAYNPHSPFAAALRTRPWYDVVGRSGFLLGRTDPATDPKGVLAVTALREAARRYNVPRLAAIAASTNGIFEETALVGELQAGQLDAGFFYNVEARAAHLSTRPLTGTDLFASYTIAELNHAPHPLAAKAFLAFLLHGEGRQLLGSYGLTASST